MDRLYPYQPQLPRHPLHSGPPRIAGAQTRRLIYTADEEAPVGTSFSTGQKIEFLQSGVITELRLGADFEHPSPLHLLDLDIVKEGTTHLCTDGFRPRFLTGESLRAGADLSSLRCWIPVRRGEEWMVYSRTSEQAVVPWQLALTLEAFVEPVDPALWIPTETQFYRAEQVVSAESDGAGLELDFQRDGVVTGMFAENSVSRSVQAGTFDLAFDVLRDGVHHLVTQGRSASRVRNQLVSAMDGREMFPVWFPVRKHSKWQVFPHNYGATPEKFALLLRVEEFANLNADAINRGLDATL